MQLNNYYQMDTQTLLALPHFLCNNGLRKAYRIICQNSCIQSSMMIEVFSMSEWITNGLQESQT